jgi:hypothetical protein
MHADSSKRGVDSFRPLQIREEYKSELRRSRPLCLDADQGDAVPMQWPSTASIGSTPDLIMIAAVGTGASVGAVGLR